MGAYIYFRVADPELAADADEWLAKQPENQEVEDYEYGQAISLWTEEDREIELKKLEEKGHGAPDFHDIGEGQLKTSCLTLENAEEIKSLWVSLFEKMHNHDEYEFEVLSDSCGLRKDYFTPEQLAIITDNCDALTGTAIAEIGAIARGVS